MGIGVAFATVTLMVVTGRMRDWRLMRRLLGAIAVAVVVMLPWAIPYLLVHREAGAGRTINDAARGGAVIASYVQAPPTNLLYGRTGWLRPGPGARLSRTDHPEQDLFPGFCALILALLGATVAAKGLKKTAIVYVVVAMAGVVLSLGPTASDPSTRCCTKDCSGWPRFAPRRGSPCWHCAESPSWPLSQSARWKIDASGLTADWPRHPRHRHRVQQRNDRIPATAGADLERRAVASRPARFRGRGLHPGWHLVEQHPVHAAVARHRRPVVNGYSGLYPPFWEALLDTTNRLPSAESLLALHGLGVEYIVSDQELSPPVDLRQALVERVHFDSQRVYQLQWSDESTRR